MAGPGIRAWELSKCLSKRFQVALAIPDYSPATKNTPLFKDVPFDVIRYSVDNPSVIKKSGEDSKIILVQGYILSKFPFIKDIPAHLICDMYVPFPLENLFTHKWKIPSMKDREFIHLKDLQVFNDQMMHGDHFLCANTRQKDLFVGSLLSLNRINPAYLDVSVTLDELISVVPFGINPEGDEKAENVIQKKFPQIKRDAENVLLIWGGVISNWFDPVTLIRAVNKVVEKNPMIQLLFLSTIHPNPLLPEFDMAKEAIKISDELGLTDKHVFFNEEWVEYDKRGAYFLGADIGVSIHKVHFETYYSFRTRILDYLKYDLPIICTKGDYISELVKEKGLGISVIPENEDELAAAILNLADREKRIKIKQKILEEKKPYYWESVSEPLIQYCQRALIGEAKKKNPTSHKDMALLFSQRKKGETKSFIKSTFWYLFQKLPLKFSTKLRRLFKF
jgi:glycosyltransferase involved in cell wall biosynthesis